MAEKKRFFRRRLVILAALVLFVGVACVGFYAFRKRQIYKQHMAWRAQGMEAAAKNDAPRAVDNLRLYLLRYGNDLDALREFRRCRALVPMKDGQHISDQINVLRHILRLDPTLVDDRRELMKLYVQSPAFSAEADDAATQVLADPKYSNDPDALGVKARKLMRDKEPAKAAEFAKRWLAQAPGSLDANLVHVMLLKQMAKPDAEILAHVGGLLKAHPGDPVFEIVAAAANGMAGKPKEGAELLKAAAKRKLPDASAARTLLSYLDQFYLIEESTALLEQMARDDAGNAGLTLALSQRYWEQPGRLADLVKLSDPVTAATAAEHPALLVALRAAALCQLNRAADAKPLADALRARAGDAAAQAWAVIVAQMIAQKYDAQAVLKACELAGQGKAGDPYLHHYRAEALAQMGEKELAAREWREIAGRAPSWAVPLVRLSGMLTELGRVDEAVMASAEAMRRSPNNATTVNVFAGAIATSLQRNKTGDPSELIKFLGEMRAQVPQDESSLVMYVAVLGQHGKPDQAKAAARAALDAGHPLSEQSLMRLAAASQQFNLGLEDEFLARSEKAHGLTASLAFARAVRLFSGGKAAEGLAAFDAARAAAKDKDALAWRLSHARYLDLSGNPAAPAALAELAKAYPNDLSVQQTVLAAASVQTPEHLDLIGSAVARVQALTSSEAIGWKLARARYLLMKRADANEREADERRKNPAKFAGQAKDATVPPDVEEAITLLKAVIATAPDSLQGRVLAARAYQMARRRDDAIREFTAAVAMSPQPSTIHLQLAALFYDAGDMERSREHSAKVNYKELASGEDRVRAAALFAQQGDSDRAAALLQTDLDRGAVDDLWKQARAQVYVREGNVAGAEALYVELLAGEAARDNPMIIVQAAQLQAVQGRLDAAKQTIERLREVTTLTKPEVAVALAQFTFQYLSQAEGLVMLQAATQLAPTEPGPWRALIATQALRGDVGDARATLDAATRATAAAAAKEAPDATRLAELQRDAQFLSAAAEPLLRPVVVQWVQSRSADGPAGETLRVRFDSRTPSPEARVAALRGIADRNPRFLPVQLYLAQSYAQLGQVNEALATLTRAARVLPNASEPRQMAVGYLIQLRRWSDALPLAQLWRKDLAGGSKLVADLAIAECRLGLNEPSAAIEVLKPYVAQATTPTTAPASPGSPPPSVVMERVIPVYARAQQALGSGDPTALMEPLLRQGMSARQRWMAFALEQVDAPKATRWLDAAGAAQWIRRAHDAAEADAAKPDANPVDADQERVVVAQAWLDLAQRTNDEAYKQAGRDLVKSVVAKPTAPAVAFYVLASLCEMENDLSAAEANYRLAIAKQPSFPVAQNNLAMLLSREPRDPAKLAEAEKQIDAALIAWPAVAALYDTRATVLGSAGKQSPAIESIRRAVQLQPTNFGYRLHLVQRLLDAQDLEAAREAWKDVKAMPEAADPTRLPDDTRKKFQLLRDVIEKPAAAGSLSAAP